MGPVVVCLFAVVVVVHHSSTQAANGFTTLMQGGNMKKEYFAKVRKIDLRQAAQGLPGWATLTCVGKGVYRLDAPIRTKDPMVGSMCCAEDGKEASTLFEVVDRGKMPWWCVLR